MDNTKDNILQSPVEVELSQAYMDYAMSVITSRALPDIRDGLKLVHRRILFAMYALGNFDRYPSKKSARIVGDVVGKYHPHGTDAVYEALVRMEQDFTTRYPLVKGQGNMGSIDGDRPAAMRYTGVKLSPLGEKMLAELKYHTVDYIPNYDDTESVPSILPAQVPLLLMNGSSGIAVGLATNIPPHNLNDIITAVIAHLKDPNLTLDVLARIIVAPDFPTGGIICNMSEMHKIYTTGKGSVILRSRISLDRDEHTITILDLPYGVTKSDLVTQIAELVNSKTVVGIQDIVDESAQQTTEIKIYLQRHANPKIVLNNLYRHSKIQNFFHVNMVALDKGIPKLCNIKDLIEGFTQHRLEIIYRRSDFLLSRCVRRLLRIQGLATAIANIEHIVKNVKQQANTAEAKEYLLASSFSTHNLDPFFQNLPSRLPNNPSFHLIRDNKFKFSEEQANAVLEIKITALPKLDQRKIVDEGKELLEQIYEYQGILESPERRITILEEELLELQSQFNSPRKTQLEDINIHASDIDLIEDRDLVVSYSEGGYIKAQAASNYRLQQRGGLGKSVSQFKVDDLLKGVLLVPKKSSLICFSSIGKAYSLKCYNIPEYDRGAKGRPITTLVPFSEEERITEIIQYDDTHDDFLLFVTKMGRVALFSKKHFTGVARKTGLKAIKLFSGDALLKVIQVQQHEHIMMFSSSGRAVRFALDTIRPIRRGSQGVLGMKLKTGEYVISAISLCHTHKNKLLLTVSAQGIGKLSAFDDYPLQGRNTLGVRAIPKTQSLIDAALVSKTDEVMLFTSEGVVSKISITQIGKRRRTGLGVKLMALKPGSTVIKIGKSDDH